MRQSIQESRYFCNPRSDTKLSGAQATRLCTTCGEIEKPSDPLSMTQLTRAAVLLPKNRKASRAIKGARRRRPAARPQRAMSPATRLPTDNNSTSLLFARFFCTHRAADNSPSSRRHSFFQRPLNWRPDQSITVTKIQSAAIFKIFPY